MIKKIEHISIFPYVTDSESGWKITLDYVTEEKGMDSMDVTETASNVTYTFTGNGAYRRCTEKVIEVMENFG